MSDLDSLQATLRGFIAEAFSLERLDADALLLHTPFAFDDGDGFPLVLEHTADGWQITDRGGSVEHLSYYDVNLTESRKHVIKEIARTAGLKVDDWELVRPANGELAAADVFDFLHAMARVADLGLTSTSRIANMLREDLETLVQRRFPASAYDLDYVNPRDPDGIFSADVLFRRGDPQADPLLGFAVWNNDRADRAAITLLQYEAWGLKWDSVVFLDEDVNLSRRQQRLLNRKAGMQFSNITEREEEIASWLHRQGVPTAA